MDEARDLRYLKKSFKQLRKSRHTSAGIESFGVAFRRPDDLLRGRSPTGAHLGLSLEEYAKTHTSPSLGSGLKTKPRQTFASPTKTLEHSGQVVSAQKTGKYVQMRRSQNNRILSHIRVVTSDQGSSIGDTRPTFARLHAQSQVSSGVGGHKGHTAGLVEITSD